MSHPNTHAASAETPSDIHSDTGDDTRGLTQSTPNFATHYYARRLFSS